MTDNNEQMQQMDCAATEAKTALLAGIDGWSAKDLVIWWNQWYLKAGHKRLGRLLVDQASKIRSSNK